MGESDEIVRVVSKNLTNLEWRVWGSAIEKQIRSPGSRFWKNVGKYGPAGAGQITVGRYWLGPPALIAVLIFVVIGISRSGYPIALVILLVAIGMVLVGMAMWRAATASISGRKYRESKGGFSGSIDT